MYGAPYAEMGTGGVGLSGHRNAYNSQVLIGNWVEDLEVQQKTGKFRRGAGFLDMDVPFESTSTMKSHFRAPEDPDRVNYTSQRATAREVKQKAKGADREHIMPVHMAHPSTLLHPYTSLNRLAFSKPWTYKRPVEAYVSGGHHGANDVEMDKLLHSKQGAESEAAVDMANHLNVKMQELDALAEKVAFTSTSHLAHGLETRHASRLLVKGCKHLCGVADPGL